jgi:hypothetical protein
MKKIDIIQTTIIIVGILVGYSAIQIILGLFTQIAYTQELGGPSVLFQYILFGALHAACSIVLISKSKKISLLIVDESDDSVQINISRTDIIFAMIVGIGLYTLIQPVPQVLTDIFFFFKNEVRSNGDTVIPSKKEAFAVELLRVLFGFFIIYGAPTFTNIITDKIASKIKPLN